MGIERYLCLRKTLHFKTELIKINLIEEVFIPTGARFVSRRLRLSRDRPKSRSLPKTNRNIFLVTTT